MATSSAYDRLLDELRTHGSEVRENGNGHAMAQCPAHDDRNLSLSVTSTESRVLIHCHARCRPMTCSQRSA